MAATLDVLMTNVAAVTETWLHSELDDRLVNIRSCTLHRRDRHSGRGGGVCSYVSHNIQSKRRIDLENPHMKIPQRHMTNTLYEESNGQ